MLDSVLSRQAGDLYQRLLAGEYHSLASDAIDSLDHDALELVRAGFARVQDGDPPLLRPVAPAAAVQEVLGKLATRISSWQEHTAHTVHDLITLQRSALSIDGRAVRPQVEVVTNAAAVIDLVDSVQRGARHELLSLDSTAAAGSSCQPRLSPVVASPPAVWKTVFTADFDTPELSWILDGTRQAGGEVRLAATLPMKLLIADRSTALVPLDESGSAGVVLFRSSTVVGALVELFGNLWDRATSHPGAPSHAGGLTPYQRHVLTLLAASLKDEEIAARTHVSIRTVRRNVAAILDRLGVTTRFAAGVQAAKRGWL
ncbi:LuxR C-terminal-related transcriptional regulator [Actinocatenispora sera]|uniref:helix-turn-helix transcriptional regulator n=1 Tax=Actinocatenispora sera TaxID=390989 RepID=UPI0033C69E0A